MSNTTITLTNNTEVEVLTSDLTTTGILSYADFSSTISDKSTIKGVAIGNGVTQIANETFKACENLETLTFKQTSSLTTIGVEAFFGSNSNTNTNKIASVTIPASVTVINASAFDTCRNMETITFESGSKLETIGNAAFAANQKVTTLTLPDSLKTFGLRSFYNCEKLETVTLGSGLTSFGAEAFETCDELQTVDMTKATSLTTIQDDAFKDCDKLTSVTFPNNLTTLGGYIFEGCSLLTELTIPNSVQFTLCDIDAFYGSSITTIKLKKENQLGPSNNEEVDGQGYTIFGKSGITVVIINSAPVFSSTTDTTTATEETDFSYELVATASDDDGDTLIYSLWSGPAWISFNATTKKLTGKPPEAENDKYTVEIRATDPSNEYATFTLTINIIHINNAPVFNPITGTTTATEDTAFTYTVAAASDVDSGDSLTYSKQSGPSWVSFNTTTRVLSGKPLNANVGTGNTVVIRATDGSGAYAEFTLTITVANANDAPVFNPTTGTANATEDTAFTYTVAAASDVDSGDSLTYSKQSGPSWVSFNTTTRVLSGKPLNANVGTGNTVIIRATDGSGAYAEFTLTITVANVNDAPTFTSTPVTTAKTGLLYTYEVKTSDDDGDSVTVTATTIPSWLEFDVNTNVLSQTPSNDDVGTHSVVLTARDSNDATATQSFTISVSQFKPADKTALQTAIDKWYDLANDGSTTAVTTANNYDGSEYFGNPNTWDVSLITDLSYVFFKKDQDDHPDISTWNVSNVTSMQGTFSNSTFNGELINWNVVNVTDFSFTFANNVVFNQELKRWNVQDATTMESMFDNAYSFNQTIEPPMMQNKDGTDFPTQLTWNESTINDYLTTIYGSATPQTNPTTFKGVFGMIALLKKTYLDALNGTTYNTIQSSFSEVISELITNQQEILKYNYTYDGEQEKWIPTSPTIYFANTKDKSGDELNEAKDSLNQLRLNTIVDGMLLINKAYDIAKGLGADYSDLSSEMENIYDDVYNKLPFYVAWYAPLLTTKANFLNNAFTFHNGATGGNIEQKLTKFINDTPIKSINGKDYSSTDKQIIVKSSSDDLYQSFANEYNPTSSS